MIKMHTKQFISWYLLITAVIILIACLLLSSNEMRIKEIDISKIAVLSGSEGAWLNPDNAILEPNSLNKDKLTINGWAIISGRSTQNVAIHIILKNMNTGICYELPTSVTSRTDVTSFVNDGVNYDNSGFESILYINSDRFNFETTDYKVMALYQIDGEQYVIDSGINVKIQTGE